MSTIFVSIASYCDSLLTQTIENALDNARYPDDLRFGVVEQSTVSYADKLRDTAKKQVRLLSVDPKQSRGACWARSLVMSMYGGEDWFFQIDSHTIFDQYWDACLLGSWADAARQSPKPFLSSYPHSFEIIDGALVKKPSTNYIIAHVIKKDTPFPEKLIDLTFSSTLVDQTTPLRGFHLAAGCVFAPGDFVCEVPYDPAMYFQGEEALWALRAYTHGWDVFHPARLPVYHHYETEETKTVVRGRHWNEQDDAERATRWWELNNRANQRMEDVIAGKNLGVYGLGKVRTLEDYAAFSGIDYKNRVIHSKAYVGPWAKE